MDWILENINSIIEIALNLVGAFAVVATMTPNDSDNKFVDSILKVINILGANFGKASNG
jgi:hypothetical protein